MTKSQYKLTIFLGDIFENLSVAAKLHDQSAWLLHSSNYKEFITTTLTTDTTVYTSLGDLPKDLEVAWHILNLADQIVYCPPPAWSDSKPLDFTDPTASIQGLTEKFLLLLPDSIQIENFQVNQPVAIPLVDQRKSNLPQLWIAGCSISHGDGVRLDNRYGQLLANELNLPCSFLTKSGSSIDWAADQLLRSNIQKGDLIVWGLTSPERLTHIHNHELINVTPNSYIDNPQLEKTVKLSNLYSQTTIYKHFYAVQQVINYCKKSSATLILIGLLPGLSSIQRFFKLQKNYVHVPYQLTFNPSMCEKFIDLGDDNLHPGPAQHVQYKNLILDRLNK